MDRDIGLFHVMKPRLVCHCRNYFSMQIFWPVSINPLSHTTLKMQHLQTECHQTDGHSDISVPCDMIKLYQLLSFAIAKSPCATNTVCYMLTHETQGSHSCMHCIDSTWLSHLSLYSVSSKLVLPCTSQSATTQYWVNVGPISISEYAYRCFDVLTFVAGITRWNISPSISIFEEWHSVQVRTWSKSRNQGHKRSQRHQVSERRHGLCEYILALVTMCDMYGSGSVGKLDRNSGGI